MTAKTVIVTGGFNGIGLVISQTLLARQFRVVIADIAVPNDINENLQSTNTTTPFINPFANLFDPSMYLLIHCDVSNEQDVKNLMEKTIHKFSRLDAIVNNAAVSHPHYHGKDITELSLEEWNRVVSINLTSVFLTTKYGVPYLKQSRGCIINISSTRALQSEANTEIYSATKGGVLSLTHSLAISLGPEINVNCISPGWIDVQSHQVGKERQYELREGDHKQHPVGRVGRPEDVAKLCLFLIEDGCQDGSGFITGQNFVIDGGMTKKMIYNGEPWWKEE
ncbi:hypothetical protein C9374_005483 [Naegleria lovaniensis]|uniref:Uncharacterized protein n=1 Tax=Naegleria lovaniensis TaxID=51637 RepID=A0AA88KN80_NAELO|nr:uncharacterized protein C9374_005483 [Naegleria lovaniensis]KAG2382281.1 hypothetical protein C9374_005483 [Naegleria lovaniensis]